MAEIDYNEILLEAIDAVVSSRLADVNFDRTIVATIIDASKAKEGEYTLSNESIEFVATSENTNYKKNDRVNVLIPSNDYSNPKTILGKCATKENETPVAYVSPLQKIIMAGQNYTKDKSAKLRANTNKDGSAKMVEICTKTVTENSTSFDTLYVSADFKTLFSGYDMRTGRFGLLITMETDGGYTHAVTLDSAKDMFGNPYNFFAPFTQEQAYELNLPDKVKSITVHLYEMGDFTYNDGINPQPMRLGYVEYDNILVSNISVGFGYNAEQVPDNTVKIHAASLTYNNIKDSDITKKIELTWYNKDENNKYLGFTDGTFDQQDTSNKPKYTIKWYHNQNNGSWKDLDEGLEKPKFTNQTTIYAPINSKWAVNEYKAVIQVLESGQDEPNSYTSNVLTFKVATGYDSNIHDALNMNLTLHNGVESLDAYPFYGADSAIINPGEASKNRGIYFSYAGATGNLLEPDILNGATAYFYIPTISTMLELPYGVDPCGEEQGYKVYKKTYTNEFNEIKSGSFNILKNTAPSELIGMGKNYNYTKAIYGWESGSGTVTARSTDSGKKTIRLANEADTNATLQAMQSVSLKKDKEYTISTLVYPKRAEGIQISLSYEDGTKEVLNTTITSHDSNWNKVVATLKPNAEKTGVLKICLEASVKNKSYVLWHETMLVEGSNAAEKWRPAENEIDEHLNAAKTFTYRVKEIYNPLFKNNEVKLKIVDKNGFEYSAVKSFSFSSYGTSGTDYTLVIEDPEQQIATLYDANYKPVEATIAWGFYPQYSNNTVTKDSGYKVAKASTSVNWVSGTVNLSALKGIPLETNEYYYQGPTTIVYDSSGVNPKYYDGDLGLFVKATNEPVTGLTWSLQYYNYNDLNTAVSSPVGQSNYPQLTGTSDGNRRLKAPSMFLAQSTESSDPYYYIVLVASKGNSVYWRQPLIILQNQHSSALLNNWDGELQVDRENNYILSAMMGAGSKNSDNEFTGVIMGNTAKLDGNGAWSNAEHGLFGYHEGAQSFGFKTDGKAFIGKAGGGRIEFNGTQGVISSSNYSSTGSDGYANAGMYIGLKDGEIRTKGFQVDANGNAKFKGEITATRLILSDGAELDKSIATKEALDKVDKAAQAAASAAELANQAAQDASDKAATEAQKAYNNAITQAKEDAKSLDDALATGLKNDYEKYTNSEIGKLDTAVTNYLTAGGKTVVDDKYVISPYIGGGYLNITSNNARVIIDPGNQTGNGYLFQVQNVKDKKIVMGVDSSGNAVFAGQLNAATGSFAGSINVANNFIVDGSGNVTLNGNITWGTGASPTQIVYSSYTTTGGAPTKPADGTSYSNFPPSSSAGSWHKNFDSANDRFGSYTYDGGKTWGAVTVVQGKDGQPGAKGNTIKVVQAFYRSSSATPPTSAPSGSTLPSGWTWSASGVTSSQKYEYISQCTVTNSTYGSWSSPVLFARYGSDGTNGKNGSDATVNILNMYNAVTNNGSKEGIFKFANGNRDSLIINANFINTGTLRVGNTGSEILFADINNKTVEIGGWDITSRGLSYNDNYYFYREWDNNDRVAVGGNSAANNWRLLLGRNGSTAKFGVDKNGALYSSSGNIGGWSIGSHTLSGGSITLGDSTETYSLKTTNISLNNFSKSYGDVTLGSAGSSPTLITKTLSAKGDVLRIYNVRVIDVEGETVYYTDPVVTFNGRTITVRSTIKDSGIHQAGITVRVYYEYKYSTTTAPGFSVSSSGTINCRRMDLGPSWKFDYTHFKIEKGQEDYVYLGTEGITLVEQDSVKEAVAWNDIATIGKGLTGWALVPDLGWMCFSNGVLIRTIGKSYSWTEIANADYYKTGVKDTLKFY